MKRFVALIICFCLFCVPVRAAENEKLVALTFDDGPSERFTQKLLEGLEERGSRATFLLCGYRMEQYPDLTQRIFQEGHEIGLHGYSHKSMRDMCQRDAVQEIRKALALLPDGCKISFLRPPGGLCSECVQIVTEEFGLSILHWSIDPKDWAIHRPPGGLCSECVQIVTEEFGLSILHWSIDPKDWAIHNAKAIKNEVIRHVRDGDVILLHDMSDSSVEAALKIVDELQEQGFRFVTASELARARNITLVPGTKYTRFYETDPQERK